MCVQCHSKWILALLAVNFSPGACMMMEFGYNGQILETFTPLGFVDQQKESALMWLVKTEVLPWAYWNLMTKGFVPWSEVKNNIKSFQAKLLQRQELPVAP